MKNRPIHENLDTSFVNLSALLRYLRRRQFDGSIRVELSGYEADIVLTGNNQITVREYDQIAGRIAEGEEALQRILIRAREPGGIIHVYQNMPEGAVRPEKIEPKAIETPAPPQAAPAAPAIPAGSSFAVKPVANGNGNGNSKPVLPTSRTKRLKPRPGRGPSCPIFRSN